MKKAVLILNIFVFAAIIGLDVALILSPTLLLKSLSSACFMLGGIINAVYALKNGADKKFTFLMLAGFAFAMAGDIINYNPADLYFIIGTALFALAHVFYVAAYFCLCKFRFVDLIPFACVLIPSVLFITLAPIFDFGGALMEIVCVVYAVILSAMVGKAIANLRLKTALSVLIAVGSILFFVSDLSLLINMFSGVHKIPRILCLATYYPAQFLLAFAVFENAVKGVNTFKAVYCRIFQFIFKIALPILPYRNPKIIDKTEDVPAALKENGKKKPLIVTDKTVRSLGLTLKLEDGLAGAGLEYALFDEVVANPTTENVAAALKIFKESGCDSLIAFGGGSPMDCAKGVGALVAKPNKTLNKLGGILKVGKKIPLLIAVPTTAGTGSETTLAAVIVDSQTRHKYAINDFPLIPSYAVLDEEVTMTLPKSVVATTGMDALTHAIEAYIGKSGNKGTRADALEAIKLIFENLETSYEEGTRESRKNMLVAAHKAGRAFSKAYVGYVHSLAHALGGKYNTPHGLANAVILPVVLENYGKAAHKKLWKIALYCNLIDESVSYADGAKIIIDKIKDMNKKFGIPRTLEIKEEDLDELSAYAEKEANPLYPVPALRDRAQLKELYKIIGGENNGNGGN